MRILKFIIVLALFFGLFWLFVWTGLTCEGVLKRTRVGV